MGRRSYAKHEEHAKKLIISQTINLPRSWDFFERFNSPYLYPFQSHETITIKQSEIGDAMINATVWDVSIVMSKFFEKEIGKEGLKNKRIIELGAGVGLSACVLSRLGANIIATEQKSMHNILQFNVRENCTDFSKTKVAELWWGDDVRQFKAPFDMIVGSDLIYEDRCVDLLFKSLLDLSSFHPKPKSKYSDIIEIIDSNNGELTPELINKLKAAKVDGEDDEEVEAGEDDKKETTTTTTTTPVVESTTTATETTAEPIPTEIKKKRKSKKVRKEDDETLKDDEYLWPSCLLEPCPDSIIYLGYENRQMSAESLFLNKVNYYFHVEELTTTHLNPGFGGVDIRILKMKKKHLTMEQLIEIKNKINSAKNNNDSTTTTTTTTTTSTTETPQ